MLVPYEIHFINQHIDFLLIHFSFPFLMVSSPGGVAASAYARAIYYAPIVCIFQFGWAATQVAHMSLIPELAVEEGDTVILNALRYGAQV